MKKFDPDIFMAAVYREAGEKMPYRVNFRQVLAILPIKGEQFLKEAYSALLNREPDPAGAAAYQRRAESLPGRFLILIALYFSPERIWLPAWQRAPLQFCRNVLGRLRRLR